MNLSTELILMIIINVLLGGVYIGGLAMSIKFIEEQIKRLEHKQDQHNNLIERMAIQEMQTKAIWKTVDEIKDFCNLRKTNGN